MKFTTHLELQSQTTRLVEHTSYAANSRSETGFSPSMMPCFKRLAPRSHADNTSLGYNSRRGLPLSIPRLSYIPLHSPLLGESLLVSFPPLNNMLKFRGSSCFIWDLIQNIACVEPESSTYTMNSIDKTWLTSSRSRSPKLLQLTADVLKDQQVVLLSTSLLKVEPI